MRWSIWRLPGQVVAAGGIADRRGLPAVLTLGAQWAWIATRFLAAVEADIHTDYRHLFAASADDTVCFGLYDGGWSDAPALTYRPPAIAAWESAGFCCQVPANPALSC